MPTNWTIPGGLNFGQPINPLAGYLYGGLPGLAAQYGQAYQNALGLNQGNYGNILGGYQQLLGNLYGDTQAIGRGHADLYKAIMDKISGLGTTREQEIRDQYKALQGQSKQSMTSRGLGNTTVRDNAAAGLSLDEQKALNDQRERMAQQQASYMAQQGNAALGYMDEASRQLTGLGGKQLDWMNSIMAPYPSSDPYNQIFAQQGQWEQAEKDRQAMLEAARIGASRPIYAPGVGSAGAPGGTGGTGGGMPGGMGGGMPGGSGGGMGGAPSGGNPNSGPGSGETIPGMWDPTQYGYPPGSPPPPGFPGYTWNNPSGLSPGDSGYPSYLNQQLGANQPPPPSGAGYPAFGPGFPGFPAPYPNPGGSDVILPPLESMPGGDNQPSGGVVLGPRPVAPEGWGDVNPPPGGWGDQPPWTGGISPPPPQPPSNDFGPGFPGQPQPEFIPPPHEVGTAGQDHNLISLTSGADMMPYGSLFGGGMQSSPYGTFSGPTGGLPSPPMGGGSPSSMGPSSGPFNPSTGGPATPYWGGNGFYPTTPRPPMGGGPRPPYGMPRPPFGGGMPMGGGGMQFGGGTPQPSVGSTPRPPSVISGMPGGGWGPGSPGPRPPQTQQESWMRSAPGTGMSAGMPTGGSSAGLSPSMPPPGGVHPFGTGTEWLTGPGQYPPTYGGGGFGGTGPPMGSPQWLQQQYGGPVGGDMGAYMSSQGMQPGTVYQPGMVAGDLGVWQSAGGSIADFNNFARYGYPGSGWSQRFPSTGGPTPPSPYPMHTLGSLTPQQYATISRLSPGTLNDMRAFGLPPVQGQLGAQDQLGAQSDQGPPDHWGPPPRGPQY